MEKLVLLFLVIILASCEKQEIPVPDYDRGNVITQQIEMTANYKNQVWYSLSDSKVVATNLKTDWDIAFETGSTGFHLKLNSSKSMRAYKTNYTSLTDVMDTTGISKGIADAPGGNTDSTAIGNWQTTNNVYIINRGYNESGQHLGYIKLKMVTVSSTHYTFEYGSVSGTAIFQGTINKDGDYNFNYYSFTSMQQVIIEPKKAEYDFCFTQYTDIFYNPFQYYLVTGALQNSYNTSVAYVFEKDFANITIADTSYKSFYPNQDAIGYKWKAFSYTTNTYSVDINKCYIIKDSKGFYYKLHFIDFYNEQGQKGYPKFEYKKL